MKNKKRIQLALLVIVLAIWAFVGYRLLRTHEENPGAVRMAKPAAGKGKLEVDSTLVADYRDPFLELVYEEEEPEELPVIDEPVIVPYQWPNISFKGSMKNKSKNKLIALISIDGKDVLVKKGDRVNGIMVEQIYRDSIYLFAEKERKTYFK